MKRGESGLSLLVGVNKPLGLSSHDVVNRVRRIFGERRVGHTGTLDPLASGVLPICVGPATRLDRFMTGHDKRYRVTIAFGFETTTDDAEGTPTVSGSPDGWLFDAAKAQEYLDTLVGSHEQVPPAFSAVKVNGKKSYEVARAGDAVDLSPRRVEVFDANLAKIDSTEYHGMLTWDVDFSVSKGTYIRALARDLGREVGCPAHVAGLKRVHAGLISLEDCVTLETLEVQGAAAALDPVAALGMRYAFADDLEKKIQAGASIEEYAITLKCALTLGGEQNACTCMSAVRESPAAPVNGENVCLVVNNRLKAIYAYNQRGGVWTPTCVFSVGVQRC